MTADAVTAPAVPLYHPTLGCFDFQADGMARVYLHDGERRPDAALAIWSTGIGKQAPVDEPVLTPSGWRPIGDLVPGDQVFSVEGEPISVLSTHPQVDRRVYKITFSDGSWTRCGPDHLWTIYSRTQTPRRSGPRRMAWREQTLTTREILELGVTSPNGKRRWRIPITAPVRYPERDLPVDPYLLGLVLGDGSINHRGAVALTCEKEILDSLHVRGSRRPHRTSVGVETMLIQELAPALRMLGLAGHRAWEKFVPEDYLRASVDQRLALLSGLLDTDGSPISTGGAEFTSTSEALADAVVELAESLGGQGRKATSRITSYVHKDERLDGRPSWRVNVKIPMQPFRLTRKMLRWVAPTKYPVARYITTIEADGQSESVCIRVDHPSGLYLTRHHIVTHNTHLGMGTSCLLLEDDKIDHVLVVAEQGKVRDWAEVDFPTHTDLIPEIYLGPRRARVLTSSPQVIVTTYETFRNDVARFRPRSNAITGPGPLLEWWRGRRLLVIYDEVTKLRTRSSKLHVAHDYALNRVVRRNRLPVRVLGLTATSVERSPEDVFNIAKVLAPQVAGTVESFVNDHVRGYDIFANPSTFKNIFAPGNERMPWDGVTPTLTQKLAPIILRKRKNDPDVRDQFPKMVEEQPTAVLLSDRHYAFYEAVSDTFIDADDYTQRMVFGLMRQIAGHPMSLTRSEGKYARAIYDEVGERGLHALGCAKEDALIEKVSRLNEQQGVIFTFYGQSVLPLLHQRLVREGYKVSINHGGMSSSQRHASQEAFKGGDTQIFLSSDAGARGLNLGVGSWLCHYELPMLFSVYRQRSDRVHRIDSNHESVTVESLVADGTVEVPISHMLLKRNEWSDAIDHGIGEDDYIEDADPGEQFVSADDRRTLFSDLRRRLKK